MVVTASGEPNDASLDVTFNNNNVKKDTLRNRASECLQQGKLFFLEKFFLRFDFELNLFSCFIFNCRP